MTCSRLAKKSLGMLEPPQTCTHSDSCFNILKWKLSLYAVKKIHENRTGKKKGIPLQTRKANAIKQKERDGPCNAMKTLTAFVGHNGIGEFSQRAFQICFLRGWMGRIHLRKKRQLNCVKSVSSVREETFSYWSFSMKETKKITSPQKDWPGGPITRVERDAHAAQKRQLM